MEYIEQFGIDVVNSENVTIENITKALESAGIEVCGCMWHATWTKEGYENGESPIRSD